YGKSGTTTEQFGFEEMPPGSAHDSYLWGNPALACALLLGQSFVGSGWSLQPGDIMDIDGLPVALYDDDREVLPLPCAEVLLASQAMERILDKGLMPLLSLKGKDAVRLGRFQSVASPSLPLAGRW